MRRSWAACLVAGLSLAVGCGGGADSPNADERVGAADASRDPRIEIVRADAPIELGEAAADTAGRLARVEPFLAVRPAAPATLFGGAIELSPAEGRPVWTCAILASRDGGSSWARTPLDLVGCVDPWVVFPDSITVLFSAIEVIRGERPPRHLRLVLRRSPDDGRTWSVGPDLGRGHDHELLTVDRSEGPDGGTVYLTAQRAPAEGDARPGHLVPVYRSRDGGESFEEVAELRLDERPLRPTALEVLSDGTLVLTIHDRPPETPSTASGSAAADSSAPGRAVRRAWALASRDGGVTWSDRVLVTETCGPAPELPGYPVVARDGGDGPHRDRLYHVCVRTGLDGIAVVASDDAGRTWSEPVRVDAPGDHGPTDVRSPGVAVAPDGTVGVVWYDRTAGNGEACQHLMFTASTDGGASFLPPERVSEAPSCVDRPSNARVSGSWPTGGDYGTLTVGRDGVFHTAWADARSGTFQLRHAALRVTH